jgi:tRNA(His) 5'-end guanylyltransferase
MNSYFKFVLSIFLLLFFSNIYIFFSSKNPPLTKSFSFQPAFFAFSSKDINERYFKKVQKNNYINFIYKGKE